MVAIFSLLIGLEQRRRYLSYGGETLFGTDRTFTLIGILGYVLYIISPSNLIPFTAGGGVLAILLCIYYFQKMQLQQKFGMTSIIAALITYCLAPLVFMPAHWLALLVVVTVLVLLEIKENLLKITKEFNNDEFITLAKFLVVAGVVLPLLPDRPVSAVINISPYQFWLAIVVVSGISYFSYLLRKFVFPDTGILLTGVLGGLYSSTATTVILARKSKEELSVNRVVAAMFLALAMMYLRIFALALFFDRDIGIRLIPSFAILTILSVVIALYYIKMRKEDVQTGRLNEKLDVNSHRNPLEFKTSLLFGGLFVFFAVLTGFVINQYGGGGVKVLSFIVGVTDIDPFILNLLQGKWNIDAGVITIAIVNASTSNNVLKMFYALSLGSKALRKEIAVSFGIIIAAGIAAAFI